MLLVPCLKKGYFLVSRQKIVRNQKVSPKFFEGTVCKLKLFLKSPANALSRFPLKMYHPKNSYLKALLLFIVSSVMAALLFITEKGNVISRSRQPNI